jgi:SAM-dependent methyltransferase
MPSACAIPSYALPAIEYGLLTGLLFCPDDGTQLSCSRSGIECPACARKFVTSEDGVVDLLPLRRKRILDARNAHYWYEYEQEFKRTYVPNPKAIAWGAPEVWDSGWVLKRLLQVRAVRPLMADSKLSKSQWFCDIAAGAGNYTISYAPAFRGVLHCDLSVDNLSYAARRAKRHEARNIFFLRIDYFSPPFAHSLDRVACFDTLIRGEQHEIALLETIHSAVKPHGHAVVDFHNWWHNPLRRIGLLPQNFGDNRSYRRKEVESLLQHAGISEFEFFPFYQEFNADGRGERLLSHLIAPTRLLYRFHGKAANGSVFGTHRNAPIEEFHVAQL